jgi:hypothetical protein
MADDRPTPPLTTAYARPARFGLGIDLFTNTGNVTGFGCEDDMASFGRQTKPSNVRVIRFSVHPPAEAGKPASNASSEAGEVVEDRWWRESSFDLRQGLVAEEHTIPGELLDELFRPKC